MRKIAALAILTLALGGCVPPPAGEAAPTPTPTPQVEVSGMPVPDVPPGEDIPVYDIRPMPQWIPIQPSGPEPVEPGHAALHIDFSSWQLTGLQVPDDRLPTIRRVGVKVVGYADDGTPVTANGQPWYINAIYSTPRPITVTFGPGVVRAEVTGTMFGQSGEILVAVVSIPGSSRGMEYEAAVPGDVRRGIVVLSFGITLVGGV